MTRRLGDRSSGTRQKRLSHGLARVNLTWASPAEFLFLLFALAFCVVYVVSTWHLGVRSKAYPLVLVAFALGFVGYGLAAWRRSAARGQSPQDPPAAATIARWRTIALSAALVVALVWSVPRTYASLPIGLYLFLQSWLLGARLLAAAVFSLATLLFCYVLFGLALHIPAPS